MTRTSISGSSPGWLTSSAPPAEEVRPNVIQVWSVVDGVTDPMPFELRLTRQQLRSVAYAAFDIFDDSQGEVTVPAAHPVRAGLNAFTFYTEESMDSGPHTNRTFEFDRGEMRRVR